MILFEQIAFLWCAVDFMVLRVLSFGQSLPLSAPGTRPRNPTMSPVAYFIQSFSCILIGLAKLGLCILPTAISAIYTQYNWVWLVLGPFCIFVPYYFAVFCNISTLCHYFEKFYNFNPQFCLIFFREAFDGASNIGKKLYSLIKPFSLRMLEVLKALVFSLKFLVPKGTLFTAYKQILISAGGVLKTKGYIGDLIFTPLTLIWIFWPLLIPYCLNEFYLLIPIFPIEILLIIKGYSTAKAAWGD